MNLEICSSIYGEVTMSNTINRVERLRFWCNKILPLVYDESLSYYELLCKVTQKLNELIEQNNKIAEEMGEYIAYWLTTPEGQAIMLEIITETVDQNYQNLVTRMGTAEGEIDALQSTVSGHTTNLNSLNSKIKMAEAKNFAGGNIVFFGDSWTVGGSAGSTSDRFSSRVARALGMTEFNYGVGGAGFAITNNILSGVNNAGTGMTETQKNNTTLVVITGGVNDARNWAAQSVTPNSFYDGVYAVVDAVHNIFPNALIVLAIGNTVQYGTTNTYKHAVTYTNRMIGSRSYPIKVIGNVLNWVSNTDWYNSDELHLSPTGHRVFANYVLNAIINGDPTVYEFITAIDWDSTYVSYQDGGVAHLFRYNERFVLTNVDLHFNGSYSGNHVVGRVPIYAAPQVNIYQPIYRANLVAGTMAVTYTGSINIIADGEIPNAYLPELTWRAF